MPQPMPRRIPSKSEENLRQTMIADVIRLVNRLDAYVVEIKLSARAITDTGMRGLMMEDVRQLNRAADRLQRILLNPLRPASPQKTRDDVRYAKIANAVLKRDYAIRAIGDPSYWDAQKKLLGEDNLPRIQKEVEQQYRRALVSAKYYLAMVQQR